MVIEKAQCRYFTVAEMYLKPRCKFRFDKIADSSLHFIKNRLMYRRSTCFEVEKSHFKITCNVCITYINKKSCGMEYITSCNIHLLSYSKFLVWYSTLAHLTNPKEKSDRVLVKNPG